MIAINCTHCRQRLEMDEAFAGGVCRCQHCGTIQTVPSHLKKTASAATSGNGAKSVPPGGAGHPGSGLDELADVVASSGLARSSLSRKARASQRLAPAAAPVDHAGADEGRAGKSPLVPALLGAGVVVLALVGVILYLVLSRNTPSSPGANRGGVGPDDGTKRGPVALTGEPTLTIPGPAYADVSLEDAQTVVYLLDPSQANGDVLDHLKASVYYSVEQLTARRRFQVLFWSREEDGGTEIPAYPDEGPTAATSDAAKAAALRFEDVIAYGSTQLGPTVRRAVASRPDVIVIATAKGLSLDEESLKAAEEALDGTAIKVHGFALGATESPALKQLAERTGGQYRELTGTQLDRLLYSLPQRR